MTNPDPMTAEAVERLIANIDAEMEGRARGYADVRGEMLFRCRDALSQAEARAKAAEEEVSRLRDVLLGIFSGGGEVTAPYADLIERLDAILIEQSPMHPFGCATWEEESRIAVDLAKERIVNDADRIEALQAEVERLRALVSGDRDAHTVMLSVIAPASPSTAWETLRSVEGVIRARCHAHLDARCAMLSAAPPASVGREEIARIIDPVKWRRFDHNSPYLPDIPRDTQVEWTTSLQESLAKADAILAALDPTPPEGEG